MVRFEDLVIAVYKTEKMLNSEMTIDQTRTALRYAYNVKRKIEELKHPNVLTIVVQDIISQMERELNRKIENHILRKT